MAAQSHFNVINSDDIGNYLHSFTKYAEGLHDERISSLLKLALEKPLHKHVQNICPVVALPNNPPEWLVQKWNEKAALHQFVPDQALGIQVEKVKNWLQQAIVRGEEWLKRTDEKGRPLKLLKIGSVEQVLREVEKHERKIHQDASARNDSDFFFEKEILDCDIQIVMRFPDGYRFVQLLTAEALDRETVQMQHCLGNGWYDSTLKTTDPNSSLVVYSLRDAHNKPHMTIEIDTVYKTVMQCKGKQNKWPSRQYIPYLEGLLSRSSLSVTSRIVDIGMVYHEGRLLNVHELPENFVIKGPLDLRQGFAFELPKNLTIEGVLSIDTKDRWRIPACLSVKGSSVEAFYDDENKLFYQVEYRNKFGFAKTKSWFHDNKMHREDGPAFIQYSPGLIAIHEVWYKEGVMHRVGGPAVLRRDPRTGNIHSQSFWRDGKWLDNKEQKAG